MEPRIGPRSCRQSPKLVKGVRSVKMTMNEAFEKHDAPSLGGEYELTNIILE